MSYIITILLQIQQILYHKIWLMEAFPRSKMKTPSNSVNFQGSINITSFTFFVFYHLDKAFTFALKENCTDETSVYKTQYKNLSG